MSLIKSPESLAGAIGLMFGGPQRQVLHGELMPSVGIGLAREEYGRGRWRPNGHTAATQRSVSWLSGAPLSREWLSVPRGHNRSRHGNQRP